MLLINVLNFIPRIIICYNLNLNLLSVIWSRVFKNFIGSMFWFQLTRPHTTHSFFDGYIILILSSTNTQFHLKFMTNVMFLILTLSISRYSMTTYLVPLLVVFTFLNLFGLCLILCYFVLVFFSPFSIAITSLGEERVNLSAFRTFVWFGLVCFLFLLVSGKGCGLWLWHSLDFSLTFFIFFFIFLFFFIFIYFFFFFFARVSSHFADFNAHNKTHNKLWLRNFTRRGISIKKQGNKR